MPPVETGHVEPPVINADVEPRVGQRHGFQLCARGHGRVLVAEDDRSVRDSLVRALTFEGYDVHTATDGAEALRAALDDASPTSSCSTC